MKLFGVCWRSVPPTLLAALLSLSLISCSATKPQPINTAVPTISLPDPPSVLRPVVVKEPQLGEDPLLVAARERQGRLQCNARINAGVTAWTDMQEFYSTPVK
jgi:hypothetical protein